MQLGTAEWDKTLSAAVLQRAAAGDGAHHSVSCNEAACTTSNALRARPLPEKSMSLISVKEPWGADQRNHGNSTDRLVKKSTRCNITSKQGPSILKALLLLLRWRVLWHEKRSRHVGWQQCESGVPSRNFIHLARFAAGSQDTQDSTLRLNTNKTAGSLFEQMQIGQDQPLHLHPHLCNMQQHGDNGRQRPCVIKPVL